MRLGRLVAAQSAAASPSSALWRVAIRGDEGGKWEGLREGMRGNEGGNQGGDEGGDEGR